MYMIFFTSFSDFLSFSFNYQLRQISRYQICYAKNEEILNHTLSTQFQLNYIGNETKTRLRMRQKLFQKLFIDEIPVATSCERPTTILNTYIYIHLCGSKAKHNFAFSIQSLVFIQPLTVRVQSLWCGSYTPKLKGKYKKVYIQVFKSVPIQSGFCSFRVVAVIVINQLVVIQIHTYIRLLLMKHYINQNIH